MSGSRHTRRVVRTIAGAWLLAILLVLVSAYLGFYRANPALAGPFNAAPTGSLLDDPGVPPKAERHGSAESILVDARRERGRPGPTSGPDEPHAVPSGASFLREPPQQTHRRMIADRHARPLARLGFGARGPPASA